ncbi:Aste57867_18954 [Aphanomyces stellatus]|uniref:Aste57867_18954 protein n=1 Tax=Aphanomyces stellatus TaxID=120398 RepID=A0A485LBD2_9STRA|nr:hypothetical protein As57867_018890 [Aphanomyces stellatus]VFT95684.1 Aste57867_18954 [Aphanomyces stellatus]
MARFLQGLLALSAVALLTTTDAACPNKCSGHGTCGANDICTCEQNWILADCSGRQCPFTRAWQDTAAYNDDGHYYAECGNRGLCDRSTGICTCDDAFTGTGCKRMRCPNDCSGHGKCFFIEDLAVSPLPRVGGNPGFTKYTGWDREKIQGCVCDGGWEGYTCNKRVCPKGDDPLTTGQFDMYQAIQFAHTVAIQLIIRYIDPYGNTWSTTAITTDTPANDDNTCAAIQTALQRIPNHALSSRILNQNQITVTKGTTVNPFTRTMGSPTGAGTIGTPVPDTTSLTTCIVFFPTAPGTSGLQNLLVVDTTAYTTPGSQPYSAGGTTTSMSVVEHIPGTQTAGAFNRPLTELATCSNRGLCNAESGTCTCYAGHKGLACELQEALVSFNETYFLVYMIVTRAHVDYIILYFVSNGCDRVVMLQHMHAMATLRVLGPLLLRHRSVGSTMAPSRPMRPWIAHHQTRFGSTFPSAPGSWPRVLESKVVVLDEDDLEEKFVKGGGNGGQKINKVRNSVFLKHVPTGLFVQCQKTRSLENNRSAARKLLIAKLDDYLNGTESKRNLKIQKAQKKKAKKKAKSRQKHLGTAATSTDDQDANDDEDDDDDDDEDDEDDDEDDDDDDDNDDEPRENERRTRVR